jgi:hypothetical protein
LIGAEGLGILVFQIEVNELTLGPEIIKKIISAGGENMPEFGQRNQDKKAHDEQKMGPPDDLVQCPQATLAHTGNSVRHQQANRRPE